MRSRRLALLLAVLFLAVSVAYAQTDPTATPLPSQPLPTPLPTSEPAPAETDEADTAAAYTPDPDGPGAAVIVGQGDYTFPFFATFQPDPYIVLYDVAGFYERDLEYIAADESQVLGYVLTDPLDPPFDYNLQLPIQPQGEFRDVDNDGETDTGVQMFALFVAANFYGPPVSEERDPGGILSSISISDEVDKFFELEGGQLLIWAPDDAQAFPGGYGEDGLLFTEDDAAVPLLPGWTVVDINDPTFTFDRSATAQVNLFEGEDAQEIDYSDLGYVGAFDALIELLRNEYAFTEYKGIDWDELSAQFRPRVEAAAETEDRREFRQALRDLAWAVGDGHVSGPVEIEDFQAAVLGGLGFSVAELEDGRIIVNYLTDGATIDGDQAEEAGVKLGAQILSINDTPIREVIDNAQTWESYSTPHARRLAQLRYGVRFPIGESVTLSFRNPDDDETLTVDLTAVYEVDSIFQGIFTGQDNELVGDELPIEYTILENGYGYVKIYSFNDELALMVRLWERALETFIAQQVPGVIVDMRENGGGSAALADQFPAYFFDEELVVGQTARYSEDRSEFIIIPDTETEFILPENGLYYPGSVAVLISPDCASACEGFAYNMTVEDRAAIIGAYPTAGLGGSVFPVEMPEDATFSYTWTRSLDAEGEINIEGIGVQPTVTIPVTQETVLAEEDVFIDAAVDYFESVEADFEVTEGGGISIGETLEGDIAAGQRVRYTVNVEPGKPFSIVVRGAAAPLDDDGEGVDITVPLSLVLRLYPPNVDEAPEEFTSRSDGADPYAAALRGFPPFDQAVQLTVEVGTFADGLTGTYEIEVVDETPGGGGEAPDDGIDI